MGWLLEFRIWLTCILIDEFDIIDLNLEFNKESVLNKITWSIFVAITVGILALFVYVSNESRIDLSKVDIGAIQMASEDNGNIGDSYLGDKNSKVMIVEYADYQCPGCAGFAPILKAAIADYKDDVLFIFRNYPLSYHPNAKMAASSALAAGLQGKFWEMHYKIYENQQSWSELGIGARTDYFVNLAKSLKLDTSKFKQDVASEEVSQKIAFDQALAGKAAVEATPTLFIDGKIVDLETSNTVDGLKKLIKSAIK